MLLLVCSHERLDKAPSYWIGPLHPSLLPLEVPGQPAWSSARRREGKSGREVERGEARRPPARGIRLRTACLPACPSSSIHTFLFVVLITTSPPFLCYLVFVQTSHAESDLRTGVSVQSGTHTQTHPRNPYVTCHDLRLPTHDDDDDLTKRRPRAAASTTATTFKAHDDAKSLPLRRPPPSILAHRTLATTFSSFTKTSIATHCRRRLPSSRIRIIIILVLPR